MSFSKNPPTMTSINAQQALVHRFYIGRYFFISQLPNIIKSAQRTCCPAEKNITGRLHESLSIDNTFPLVFKRTMFYVWLQHRLPGFLNLKKERFLIIIEHKHYKASCA